MTSTLWRQTGGIWPMGVSTSLTWYDFGAIGYVLHAHHIQLVIEIGVEHGGLAALLTARAPYTGLVYRGIDIRLGSLHTGVAALHSGEMVERDAWDAATVAEVGGWLRDLPGPALIFCDGGDKPRELALYAPLIRPGDVLMGHDYHNEYEDAALAAVPPCVVQRRADWLDDTLLCLFTAREGV